MIGDSQSRFADMMPRLDRQRHPTETISDVRYADTDNPRQMLDLVVPRSPTIDGPLPVVVMIHGGGWRQGDRQGYLARARSIAETGRYAAATIGYRLSDEAIWPAQIHDCKAAVRWLRAHADQYNLDTNRFAAFGGSAGGHLALMLGYCGSGDGLEGRLGKHLDASSSIQLVLERYGPTDFLTMNDAPGKMDHNAPDSPESQLVGGAIQENQTAARSASPLSYIGPASPPTLIQHGRDDMSVPLDQSRRLAAKLREAGVAVDLIEYEGAGHGLKGVQGLQETELDFLHESFWNQ